MALIKINGADLPAPAKYSFTERDLVQNSNRNANGIANWDVVRFNVGELNLTWDNVSQEKIIAICTSIRSKKSFQVTFLNTLIGEVQTRTFYSGDRSNELVKYVSSLEYWSSLTLPFVEV